MVNLSLGATDDKNAPTHKADNCNCRAKANQKQLIPFTLNLAYIGNSKSKVFLKLWQITRLNFPLCNGASE